MLIRISGGTGGIREYLENGRKKGREFTREDLDERVVLAGNLALTDTIIRSMENKGEKYLHITISFKEDHVDRDSLQAISRDFEKFAMTAYRPDEYCFYAEAHLPRIKSYAEKARGNLVERKPHIHVVIPKVNLLTWHHLDPFGLVLRQMEYIDSFQESTNRRYGLASPKDNPRTELVDKSDMIGRYKGDVFAGANHEVKAELLGEILVQDTRSLDALEALMAGQGEVRRRNPGTDREYLNLKLNRAGKGINLKEYVFSPAFLQLTLDEKIAQLEKRKDNYVVSGSTQPLDPNHIVRLKEWREFKARELKYITSGRRKEYASYIAMSDVEQALFLGLKEEAYYANIAKAASGLDARAQDAGPILEGSQTEQGFHMDCLPTNSVAGQHLEDHRLEGARKADEESALLQELKQNIDIHRVLQALARDQGLQVEKYPLSLGRDGQARIRCGTRNLNVADFMTKEMHFRWPYASDYLCALYAQQVSEAAIGHPSPHAAAWENYEAFASTVSQARREEIDRLKKSIKQSYASERIGYRNKKAALWQDRTISKGDRKAAISLLQTQYLALQEDMRKRSSEEYRLCYAAQGQSILSLYCKQAEVSAFREDVGSAVRQDKANPDLSNGIATCGIQTVDGEGHGSWPFTFSGLSHKIAANGDVTYTLEDRSVIRDAGRVVWALDESEAAMEACLRLALLKYGPKLHVFGSGSFKTGVAEMAAAKCLVVEFDDEGMRLAYRAARERIRAGGYGPTPTLGNSGENDHAQVANRRGKGQEIEH